MMQPIVLIPFNAAEAMTTAEAATAAGCTKQTIINWANTHHIGRLGGGGRWKISRVALAMHLDCDHAALRAYLTGDRQSEIVMKYYRQTGLSTEKLAGA